MSTGLDSVLLDYMRIGFIFLCLYLFLRTTLPLFHYYTKEALNHIAGIMMTLIILHAKGADQSDGEKGRTPEDKASQEGLRAFTDGAMEKKK